MEILKNVDKSLEHYNGCCQGNIKWTSYDVSKEYEEITRHGTCTRCQIKYHAVYSFTGIGRDDGKLEIYDN